MYTYMHMPTQTRMSWTWRSLSTCAFSCMKCMYIYIHTHDGVNICKHAFSCVCVCLTPRPLPRGSPYRTWGLDVELKREQRRNHPKSGNRRRSLSVQVESRVHSPVSCNVRGTGKTLPGGQTDSCSDKGNCRQKVDISRHTATLNPLK